MGYHQDYVKWGQEVVPDPQYVKALLHRGTGTNI